MKLRYKYLLKYQNCESTKDLLPNACDKNYYLIIVVIKQNVITSRGDITIPITSTKVNQFKLRLDNLIVNIIIQYQIMVIEIYLIKFK